MKNNIKKIFIVLMFFMLIFGCFVTTVYGYDWDFEQFDNVSTGNTGINIEKNGATLIKIFQVVALGIAILMLVITGIMYVLSATSEKKVEMKKHMPNYLLGVALTFSAAVLLEIVSVFIEGNINN